MKVVSFSILKGAGKTKSIVNKAANLVQKGKRVLLLDLDQQSSAMRYLNLDPEQSSNLYEVFKRNGKIYPTDTQNRVKHLAFAALRMEPIYSRKKYPSDN